MQLRMNGVAGAVSLLLAGAAFAQNQPPKQGSMTVQQTPMPATTPQSTAPGQVGTTPGQQQTTPGQASTLSPAVTGQTPSGQTTANGQSTGATQAATAADVKAGVSVYDTKGGLIGKIDSVSGADAVVDTGTTRSKIPISSFAKNDKGLVMSMTKAELEAASAKSAPAKPAKKPK
jgi:preprotein translocase subunit YajC